MFKKFIKIFIVIETLCLSNILIASNIIYGPYITPNEAQKIINSYKELNLSYFDNKIYFEDGQYVIFDDRIEKNHSERVNDADINDMFYDKYDRNIQVPQYLSDPGRYRCEEFFNKVYGSNREEIKKNLVNIKIFDSYFRVTKINGVDKKFLKVKEEVEKNKEYKKYFEGDSCAYNYRPIRGLDKLSAHSYGIAIDLNSSLSDYWAWNQREINENSRIIWESRIPLELVKIFEDNGFIWGGRWYHYDTMHFEYRPELLN